MKNELSSMTIISAIIMTLSVVAIHGQTDKKVGEREEPTVISSNRPLTTRQAEHAKLFGGNEWHKKIRESVKQEIAARKKDEISLFITEGDRTGTPYPPVETLTSAQKFTTEADAVVIGTVTAKESNITSDDKFLFTDYTLKLDDILKNQSGKLTLGSEIIVTRPGGSITLDGVQVEAFNEEWGKLEVGKKYLLFLSGVKKTASYKSLNEAGTLLIDGSKSFPLTNDYSLVGSGRLPVGNDRSLEEILADVYSALGGKNEK